jgi:hypothetical protein
MRPEEQTALLYESAEAGVVVVGVLVQAAGQEVLAVVVDELLLIGQVAVTGVETLRQEEQVADPVPVFGELAGVSELVLVSLGVIGLDVLDLEACFATALRIVHVVRRQL